MMCLPRKWKNIRVTKTCTPSTSAEQEEVNKVVKMGWMIPKGAELNPHVVRVPVVMEKVWTGQEVNKVVAKDVHEGNGRSIGRTEPWDA